MTKYIKIRQGTRHWLIWHTLVVVIISIIELVVSFALAANGFVESQLQAFLHMFFIGIPAYAVIYKFCGKFAYIASDGSQVLEKLCIFVPVKVTKRMMARDSFVRLAREKVVEKINLRGGGTRDKISTAYIPTLKVAKGKFLKLTAFSNYLQARRSAERLAQRLQLRMEDNCFETKDRRNVKELDLSFKERQSNKNMYNKLPDLNALKNVLVEEKADGSVNVFFKRAAEGKWMALCCAALLTVFISVALLICTHHHIFMITSLFAVAGCNYCYKKGLVNSHFRLNNGTVSVKNSFLGLGIWRSMKVDEIENVAVLDEKYDNKRRLLLVGDWKSLSIGQGCEMFSLRKYRLIIGYYLCRQ